MEEYDNKKSVKNIHRAERKGGAREVPCNILEVFLP